MGNKSRFIFLLLGLIVVIGLASFFYFLSVDSSENNATGYSIETVSRGDVSASIKGYGTVMSERDLLLLSPERAIIKRAHETPGNKVAKGDLLIELDEESVLKEIERMEEQIEMRKNALEKMRLSAESTQLDLKQNEETKKTRLSKLKSMLAEQEKMLEEGKIAESRVDRTRQEISQAENDLENVSQKYAIRKAQLEADEHNLEMQIESQKNNLRQKKALLGRLNIKAPVPGVILNIQEEEGAQIDEGRMLVRMSDLSSFKIVGMIESKYSYLVQTGNRVTVEAGNEKLEGKIGKIIPIMDERIQFDVHLNDSRNPNLIPDENLPLEIFSSEQKNVLRMKKQVGYEQAGRELIYRVNGSEALKTEVIFGTVGNEWCEIVSGLKEGDQILVDGPDPINGPQTIKLKN